MKRKNIGRVIGSGVEYLESRRVCAGVPAGYEWYDVNKDGAIAPVDALLVINYINANGSRPALPFTTHLDVNRDANISPVDVLLIINYLNGQNPSPSLAQCQDGIDNDGNGKIDMADPGCQSPQDNSETTSSVPGAIIDETQQFDLARDQPIELQTLATNTPTILYTPSHGNVTIIGNTARYVPATNFSGQDVFVLDLMRGTEHIRLRYMIFVSNVPFPGPTTPPAVSFPPPPSAADVLFARNTDWLFTSL